MGLPRAHQGKPSEDAFRVRDESKRRSFVMFRPGRCLHKISGEPKDGGNRENGDSGEIAEAEIVTGRDNYG